MNGDSLFDVSIQGNVSTNSNKELILEWRGKIERSFASLHLSHFDRKNVSVSIKFWILSERLQTRRNDLDNLVKPLVKPVLDGMIRMGIIEDDADIFHLEATKYPTSSEEEVQISVKEWN